MKLTSSPFFVGLSVALLVGIAVYFRIWAIDSTFSSEDRDLLRRQFDRASIEAMDESAEWRMKYDREVERVSQFSEDLSQARAALDYKNREAEDLNKRVDVLNKENSNLLERVGSLKQDLETMKQKCHL